MRHSVGRTSTARNDAMPEDGLRTAVGAVPRAGTATKGEIHAPHDRAPNNRQRECDRGYGMLGGGAAVDEGAFADSAGAAVAGTLNCAVAVSRDCTSTVICEGV